eukprot:791532_1
MKRKRRLSSLGQLFALNEEVQSELESDVEESNDSQQSPSPATATLRIMPLNTEMKTIRTLKKAYSDTFRTVKLSGVGRTKSVILEDMNKIISAILAPSTHSTPASSSHSTPASSTTTTPTSSATTTPAPTSEPAPSTSDPAPLSLHELEADISEIDYISEQKTHDTEKPTHFDCEDCNGDTDSDDDVAVDMNLDGFNRITVGGPVFDITDSNVGINNLGIYLHIGAAKATKLKRIIAELEFSDQDI